MADGKSWERIRETLEARRAELNELISAYPGPITGCDAQFNHMLEERKALNAELARLDEIVGTHGSGATPDDFARSSAFLAEAMEK